MDDQAQGLRNLVNLQQVPGTKTRTTRILTVTSGKGGVGKSNFTLNFALALREMNYRVLIFDADIGLANIDVLMGITPKTNLYHLLRGQKTIWDIIHKGHNDLYFISGGSGFHELLNLSETELERFASQIGELNGYVDFIIFDTSAGLSKETLHFIVSAQETIVVTTPEPTSITDAYAIIKMVRNMDYNIPFHLVVNRVGDLKEGKRTAEKISLVAKQFLNVDIPTLGYLPDDANVSRAVKKQVPFAIQYPNSAASLGIKELAAKFIAGLPSEELAESGLKGFLNKMFRIIRTS